MHLTAGVTAGVVIFIMSATGALLALQPQILNVLERDVRVVDAVSANRLGPQAIIERASAARDGARPTALTLDSDPRASALVAFAPSGGLYVNPYTGAILGEGSTTARAFFRTLTDWHRWLGRTGEDRATTKAITGAANLAFLGLAMSGLYLWWPRQWTVARVRAVTVIHARLAGKARDFNWHNSIGFWSAPVLIVLTLTGVVISYPWASNLVYRLTGSPMPGAGSGPRVERADTGAPAGSPASADLLVETASRQMPTWGVMTLRFPPRGNGPVSVTMSDAGYWNPFARSQLTVDARTADMVRWEPYSAMSRGQKLRGWMRFAHTGELGGLAGQIVAGLACVGGAFLVWTGLALAFRRFLASRSTSVRENARAA
jgi:uncharacterized iron-regulated membrane protein